jgi:hypothetical protein
VEWVGGWSRGVIRIMKMRLPSFAYSENLQVQDEPQPDPIPDDVSIPELAEQVARGKRKLTAQQMRMLVELLPYYSPKLTAVAVGHLTGEDFYNRLERAVNRSERAKLIEGRVIERDD